MTTRSDPVTPFALDTPLFNVLAGKRVVLASSSPRRKQILASVVSRILLIKASVEAKKLIIVRLASFDRRGWSQKLCRALSKRTCQSLSLLVTPSTSTLSRPDPRRLVHRQPPTALRLALTSPNEIASLPGSRGIQASSCKHQFRIGRSRSARQTLLMCPVPLSALQEENPEDPPDFVISADTVVVKDEVIMEKPADAQDNLRMLADLNGNKVRRSTPPTLSYRCRSSGC